MLNYSFTTLLMALLSSNLIIVLIAVCFKSRKILLSVGYKLLIVFLILTVARFIFPFELPFAKNINLSGILSKAVSRIRHVFVAPYGISVSIWSIFECVWLLGILVFTGRYIHEYIVIRRQVNRYGMDVTNREPYSSLLKELYAEKQRNLNFRIIRISGFTSPSIFGVVRPKILIPAEMELSEEDLYFTLRHEAAHHLRHDLLIKCAVRILNIFYWWNLACYWFRAEVGLMLEMRVDDTLVGREHDIAEAYMHALVNITGESIRLKELMGAKLPDSFLLTMAKEKDGFLTYRFNLLYGNDEKRKRHLPLTFALCALVFSIYLGSYLVTFEPYNIIEQPEEDVFHSDIGFYAILKSDGTYDIFFGDYLIENTDSLFNYSADIVIYEE